MGLAERLYWKFPYAAKCWTASLNSYIRDRERHGKEYDKAVADIREFDRWDRERLLEYQSKQLRIMVQHAASNVPYYRDVFSKHGVDTKTIKIPEDLVKLPILNKQDARLNFKKLVSERVNRHSLIKYNTSGTTGTPLTVYRDKYADSRPYAYADYRWRMVAGMRRRYNRSACIGGSLVADAGRTRPPFWVHNQRWNQLYMSSYHLSPKYLSHYIDLLKDFKGEFIEGYPSSIFTLAHYIIENGLRPIQFKACFTTAESLHEYQRKAILKAFGCRTYDNYGAAEFVAFATECSHGSMHLSPEVGIVEVLDDENQPVEKGHVGNLVCTGLVNRIQPFIRYRLGDLGALKEGQCPCGNPSPMLSHIEGRDDGVIITKDGRRIGRLSPVWKGLKGVSMVQTIQEDYDQFCLRIVPAKNYTESDGAQTRKNFLQYVRAGDVRIEVCQELERTSRGKLNSIISKLPKNQ